MWLRASQNNILLYSNNDNTFEPFILNKRAIIQFIVKTTGRDQISNILLQRQPTVPLGHSRLKQVKNKLNSQMIFSNTLLHLLNQINSTGPINLKNNYNRTRLDELVCYPLFQTLPIYFDFKAPLGDFQSVRDQQGTVIMVRIQQQKQRYPQC